MHKKSNHDSTAIFIEQCKKYRLNVTPQRLAIYKILVNSSEHPSAESTYNKVRKVFPNISFDTVNRTLITFSEIGMIDIIEGFTQRRRFDSDTTNHHHFHCVKCDSIIDFYDDIFNDWEIPPHIQRQHIIYGKRVVLKGLCKKCREKKI
jgi:Fur family peroxide stress response transcriptional regulator